MNAKLILLFLKWLIDLTEVLNLVKKSWGLILRLFKKRQCHAKHKLFPLLEGLSNIPVSKWRISDEKRRYLAGEFFIPEKTDTFHKVFKSISEFCLIHDRLPDYVFKLGFIQETCFIYEKEVVRKWEKYHPKNKAMKVFVEKFSALHEPYVKMVDQAVQDILKTNFKDDFKLKLIMDELFNAFSISMSSVDASIAQLNGVLTKELKNVKPIW